MHGSSGIVLNCYRKESMMTRFNIWSQTSAAYTKPNPAKMAKMGHSLTPALPGATPGFWRIAFPPARFEACRSWLPCLNARKTTE